MAAPTKIAPNVWYVAPPQSGGNVFAAFTSSYLKQRTKYAQDAMAHRLKLMVPKDNAAAINDIMSQQADMLKEARRLQEENIGYVAKGLEVDFKNAEAVRDAQRITLDASKANAQLGTQRDIAIMQQQGQDERAKLGLSSDVYSAQMKSLGKGGEAVEYNATTQHQLGLASRAIQAATTPEDVRSLLATYARKTSGWLNSGGVAGNPAQQQQALADLLGFATNTRHFTGDDEAKLLTEMLKNTGLLGASHQRRHEQSQLGKGVMGALTVPTAEGALSSRTLKNRGVGAGSAPDISGLTGDAYAEAVKIERDKEIYNLLSDKDKQLYKELEDEKLRLKGTDGKLPDLPGAQEFYQNQNITDEDAMVQAIEGARMRQGK